MLSLTWEKHDPAFNLALEEVLFEALSPELPELFFLWRNAPSVIIGRHQNAFAEVNEPWLREHRIPLVRRTTGGGAVYHDLGNLNFSFLLRRENSNIVDPVQLLAPVLSALRDLGVEAVLSSRNDLAVDGRKISGTALRRDGQRTLFHGCILVNTDAAALSNALAADPEKFRSKGVRSHRARVATLSSLLPQRGDSAELMGDLMEALTRRCSRGIYTLHSDLCSKAEELANKKYRNWEWTWGRSPRFSRKFSRRFPWGKLECFWEVREGVIQGCRLMGDFFALRDPEALEKCFLGLAPEPSALRSALSLVNVETWFSGAEREPLLSFLCGEDLC